MKAFLFVVATLIISANAFANVESSAEPQLSCSVQQVKENAYDVVFETPAFNPENLPTDEHASRSLKLPGNNLIKFWDFSKDQLPSPVESKRSVIRFTYNIQSPNGAWSTNTVTIDSKYSPEPGVMRFGLGDGSYLDLTCQIKM